MKILFILDLYKPHIGWVEVLFENLINWLIESWNQVIVLTSRFDSILSKYEKISENLEIFREWNNRYDFMFFSLFKWVKLARDCDIIHTTTYNAAIPAWIIGKISWKKVVLTVHEIFWKLWYNFMWVKWFFFKLFESFIFKFSFDKYICVSNYTKNNLRIYSWVEDKKLVTIYNWIDYKIWDKNTVKQQEVDEIRQKYSLENNYVWLFFGRSWISKWLRYYIEAIPEIAKNIPDFKAFIIVSKSKNNPANFELELIKKLKLEKNIVWIDSVEYEEIKKYILASDFVIIPSLAEGFGFAAAETCALWQNLIVTNIASLPEVVSDKINFIEPSNSQDIIEAVLKFKSWVFENIWGKRFEWEDNINRTLEIYREVLEN
ncbi:MAG: glycosyl transferase group 1 [uncultured bacterium (gcode 4)]|uniref:Glycosyl transferase group 1 n=1 Tax=uncultured bacterium (gcode 4) TaxID=1234023 RepID=K2BBQ5_9BACT|nr:MAG: glycosyl transferase group 1 [uncultured bacterium (gcode 4)]